MMYSSKKSSAASVLALSALLSPSVLSTSAFAQQPDNKTPDASNTPPAGAARELSINQVDSFNSLVEYLKEHRKAYLERVATGVLSVIGAAAGSALVARHYKRKERQALELGRDMDKMIMQTHHLDRKPGPNGTEIITLCLRNQQERRTLKDALGNEALADEFRLCMAKVKPESCIIPLTGKLSGMIRKALIEFAVSGTSASSLPREKYLMFPTLEDPVNSNTNFVTQPRTLQIMEHDLKLFLDAQTASRIRVESPYHAFRIAALHAIAKEYFGGKLDDSCAPTAVDLPVAPYRPVDSVQIDWVKLMSRAKMIPSEKPDALIGQFFETLDSSADLPDNVPVLPNLKADI
jgi:hypothetical protein